MTDGSSSVVTLSEFSGVLRRGVRVIAGVAVIGAMVGTGLVASQPRRYETVATVEVRPIVSRQDDPNLDLSRQVDPETEVAIARSLRVAERALALRQAAARVLDAELGADVVSAAAATETVDTEEARRALGDLEVTAVDDSTILKFHAASDDPAVARDLAQSSALAYLSFRRDEATAGAADSRARLEAREAELLTALAAIGTGTDTAVATDPGQPDPAAQAQAQAAIDTVPTTALPYAAVAKRQELVSIGSTFANLEALAIDPGVVLTDAALPTATTGLPLYAGPMMGLVLGLVGAVTAVFVLDRTDDRLRSSRVELNALGVPVLGNAPVAAKRGSRAGSTGVYPVNSPAGDAYRRLQGSLLFTLEHDSRSVVLVAGVTSAAAATTVAANVAVTAARAGRRTLVVGADLRRNQLAERFELPAGKGLSDVVLDGASLAESIRGVPGVDNLSVLGAGTRLDRPADVLQSESLARLLAAVEADFDLVIVEAAPILEVADAVDVAPLCHGSVVVVDAAVETRAAIADSVGQLRSVGADVVGVVVADADR